MEREQATIPSFTQATTYFKNQGKMLNDSDVSALKFFSETEIENSTKFTLKGVVGNHKIYYNKETGKCFTILDPISRQNTKEAFTDIVFQLKNVAKNNPLLRNENICIYAPACSGSLDRPAHWVNCFATFKANEPSAKVVVEVDDSLQQTHPKTGKIRQTDGWSCGIHTMEAIYGRVYNDFPYISETSKDYNITEIEANINNNFNNLVRNGLITEEERELLINNSSENLNTLDDFLNSLLSLRREIITSENRIAGYLSRTNELSQEYLEEQRINGDRTIQEINTSLQKTEETEYLKNFNNYCEFLEEEQQKLLRDVLQDEEENIKKFNNFFEDELNKEKTDYNDSVSNFIDNFLKEQTQEDCQTKTKYSIQQSIELIDNFLAINYIDQRQHDLLESLIQNKLIDANIFIEQIVSYFIDDISESELKQEINEIINNQLNQQQETEKEAQQKLKLQPTSAQPTPPKSAINKSNQTKKGQSKNLTEKETRQKSKSQQKSKLQPTPKQSTKQKSLVSQQPLTQKNQTKIEQTNPKIIFNDNCEFLEKEQADTLRDLLQEKEENIKQFNKFFENFREDGELTLSLYIEKFIADFLKKQEQTTEEENAIQEFCFSNNSQTVSKNLDCAKKEIDNLTSCCLLI